MHGRFLVESRKPNSQARRSDYPDLLVGEIQSLERQGKLFRGSCCGEKLKPAKAIFSDDFAVGSIVDINEHVLLRMTSQVTGENFYELLFIYRTGLNEPFSHIEPMRSLAAIEPKPVMRAVGTELVQPDFVFRYARLNLLKTQTLGRGD
jgi:hypothetical protein